MIEIDSLINLDPSKSLHWLKNKSLDEVESLEWLIFRWLPIDYKLSASIG